MEKLLKKAGGVFVINRNPEDWLEMLSESELPEDWVDPYAYNSSDEEREPDGRGRPQQKPTRCKMCLKIKQGWAKGKEHVRMKHYKGKLLKANQKNQKLWCPVEGCPQAFGGSRRSWNKHFIQKCPHSVKEILDAGIELWKIRGLKNDEVKIAIRWLYKRGLIETKRVLKFGEKAISDSEGSEYEADEEGIQDQESEVEQPVARKREMKAKNKLTKGVDIEYKRQIKIQLKNCFPLHRKKLNNCEQE